MSKNTFAQIIATAAGIIMMIKFITADPTACMGGPISLLYLVGAVSCLGYVAAENIDFIMAKLGFDYDYDYDEEFEDDYDYDADYCEDSNTDDLPDNVIPFPTYHNFG